MSLTESAQPIAIVTGANRGIGRATALALALRGWHTVLMCRDVQNARQVAGEIDRAAGKKTTAVIEVDLASQTSIREAAQTFQDQYPRLDALINNAAIVPPAREMTEDGIELQFAVNHLAPFLLTNLLLDFLTQSAPSRIITVSSGAHYRGEINLTDINLEKSYGQMRAYRQSKLANVLFTFELARRIKGTRVTANCLHPGLISTNVLAGLSRLPPWLRWVMRPITVSPERGARCTVKLATDTTLAETSGHYFVDGEPREPGAAARDTALAARLWTVSAEMTGVSSP